MAGKSRTRWVLAAALLLLAFSLVLFFITLFRHVNFPLETREFYASVNLTGNEGGFDLNSSALTFGRMGNMGTATRAIIFENKYSFPVEAKISVSGSISPLMFFDKIVEVNAGGTTRIVFTVASSNSSSFGFYDGTVTFKLFRAQ